jgi:hypothetical protein
MLMETDWVENEKGRCAMAPSSENKDCRDLLGPGSSQIEPAGRLVNENEGQRQAQSGSLGKWLWIEQVACDASLPPTAVRVAIVIGSHLNDKTGDAWPSIDTIAEVLEVVPNCVRKSIKALAGNGHLEIEPGGGRNVQNRYRLIAKKSHVPIFKQRTGVKGFEEKPCTPVHKTLHSCSQNPAQAFTKTLHGSAPELKDKNLENELVEGTLSPAAPEASEEEKVVDLFPVGGMVGKVTPPARSSTRKGSVPAKGELEGFDEFWQAFPRRIGKDAARKAYAAAIKRATPEEIIAGARAYSAIRMAEPDPERRERFTKHPSSWLNGGHWADEAPQFRPAPPGMGPLAAAALRRQGRL